MKRTTRTMVFYHILSYYTYTVSNHVPVFPLKNHIYRINHQTFFSVWPNIRVYSLKYIEQLNIKVFSMIRYLSTPVITQWSQQAGEYPRFPKNFPFGSIAFRGNSSKLVSLFHQIFSIDKQFIILVTYIYDQTTVGFVMIKHELLIYL